MDSREHHELGRLQVADQPSSPLPLENTDVAAQVIGALSVVTVTQRFGNPFQNPVELEYLFPLPEKSALVDFDLKIGGRVVMGELRELNEARQHYEAGRNEGHHAGLLDQRRANLYGLRIGNILPGENIITTTRYQESLKLENGQFEFVFPMGITPRFDSPGHPDEGKGTKAAVSNRDEPAGPVEIYLSLDAGVPVEDPSSPTHPIEITRLDERRCQVRLAGEHIPDRDFILRFSVGIHQVAAGAWSSPGPSGETFLAVLVPPALEEEPFRPAREFVFVLDRSGSMSGQPIAQARNALRACLRVLNPQDTFFILLFDDTVEWYKNRPSPVEQATIDEADNFLSDVDGRGGTEIVSALDAALRLPVDPERTRFVVFLTDGAVSAEKRAIEQVRRQIGSTRLFTFGIGPAVNRALLNQLATTGRGASDFLQLDEDIESAIIRFQDRISFPALTNISVEISGAKTWDVQPARLPDLYCGQALEISGRLMRTGEPVKLQVHGTAGQIPVILHAELPIPLAVEPAIPRIWARRRVETLLDQMEIETGQASQLRDQIISLALEYHLVTPFTAFVAVDPEITHRTGKPTLLQVSQPLPAGLQYDGFGIPDPGPIISSLSIDPSYGSGVMDHKNSLIYGSGVHQARSTFPKSPRRKPDLPTMANIPAPMISEGMTPVDSRKILEQVFVRGPAALHLLARTQKLNGSWNDDIEQTSAALLAFVRQGHNTHTGSFRQQVQRAFVYLTHQRSSGFAEFVRVFALKTLANSTQFKAHVTEARMAEQGLPAPAIPLEKIALDLIMGRNLPQIPDTIADLESLRLNGLVGTQLSETHVRTGQIPQDLITAWAACLRQP